MTRKRSRRVNAKGRNSYEKFVQLHTWMLKSPAHRALHSYARCLLVELLNLYNGENNGEIALSVRQAATLLGCCDDTACKYFQQLIKLGFVKENVKGSFNRKERHATTWILTMRDYEGRPATKEFMSYDPMEN